MTTIETIETSEGLEKLRGEWDELLQASEADCLFLTWEWLYTWWKNLSEDRKLFIITVRSGRKLLAIAPLALRPPRLTLSPFLSLEFLGTGSVGSDYLDLIIRRGEEQEVLQALAGYLSSEKLMIQLAQVKKGSSFAKEFAVQLRQRGWSFLETKTDVCPFINLSGQSWESYLAGLGQSHRNNFKRRLKNLTKEFDVQFEISDSEERRHGALKILIDLHNMRWKGRGTSSAFHTSGVISFHEDLSRLALERGWLRLYVLWLNGRPAASLYGFKYGPVFYFYQSGLDPQFEKQSVGLITMGLAIKGAIEECVKEYDLLHGDEQYKFLWAHEVHELSRLELYPPQIRGLLYRQTMGWLRASRRVAKHVISRTLAR
jgi:CelD/BcsL family acetyltransferase involved in cellulose biosynthesis